MDEKKSGAPEQDNHQNGYYKNILNEADFDEKEDVDNTNFFDDADDVGDDDFFDDREDDQNESREYIESPAEAMEAEEDDDYIMPAFNVKKLIITLVIILVAAVAFVAGWRAYYAHQLTPVSDSKKKIIVEIPEGSTIEDISRILYDKGLIRSRMVFQSYAGRHSRGSKKIKASNYQFTPSMSSVQIFNAMLNGKDYDGSVQITIPEGKSIKEMADIFESHHICNADDFIAETKKISDYKKKYSILSSYPDNASGRTPMEGYLFADTYNLNSHTDASIVVGRMLQNTQDKFTDTMLKQIKDQNKTVDQVITLASVVQKEAKHDSDMPKMASVFYNRIAANMPLQSDATVVYALGGKKEELSNSDLKTKSPYNTYVNKGLPVGPICSPGVTAIKAAISPENTKYYYFVSNTKTGKTYYAQTYDEHQANVKKAAN